MVVVNLVDLDSWCRYDFLDDVFLKKVFDVLWLGF